MYKLKVCLNNYSHKSILIQIGSILDFLILRPAHPLPTNGNYIKIVRITVR